MKKKPINVRLQEVTRKHMKAAAEKIENIKKTNAAINRGFLGFRTSV